MVKTVVPRENSARALNRPTGQRTPMMDDDELQVLKYFARDAGRQAAMTRACGGVANCDQRVRITPH